MTVKTGRRKGDDYAALMNRAASPAARALVDSLEAEALEWEEGQASRTNKRGKRAAGFHEAIERFTGDLLRAKADTLIGDEDATGRVYHSLNRGSFTGGPVAFRMFEPAMRALVALGYVLHEPGTSRYGDPFGDAPTWRERRQLKGTAPRFTVTDKLVQRAAAMGVTLEVIDEHFHVEPPAYPVTLSARRSWSWGVKTSGERIDFKHTLHTDNMAAQVHALNEFLSHHTINGGVHYGFIRRFNEGDVAGFNWQWGGRLYSITRRSYQHDHEAKRAQMTIDGEPVVEIDVSASYLTAFHAMIGERLDTSSDPYSRIPFKRSVVKTWLTIAFGRGKTTFRQWPKSAPKQYAKRNGGEDLMAYPPRAVAKAALAAYPALKRIGEPGVTWADLMFRESEAIIATALRLMDFGIPALPVHDSIIVRVNDAKVATDLLFQHYRDQVGLPPLLKTKTPLNDVRKVVDDAVADNIEAEGAWAL
jgi:hypothetical protein